MAANTRRGRGATGAPGKSKGLPRLGGRGRRHRRAERMTILGWLDEARSTGARLAPACAVLGLDPRTVQRWRSRARADAPGGDDRRQGPKCSPPNRLSEAERAKVLAV
ncbi:MAG: helix-turn-helix domain-containing protein, partial [Bacteroidota bacterium]